MANRTGVEMREKSIRVGFSLNGEWVRETLDVKPTPVNQRYAERLVADVKKAIANGTFVYWEFFPESPRAKKPGGTKNFGEMCDLWFATKGRLASKSLNQYRNALGVWKVMFGEATPMDKLTHATVAAKVGSHPWASAKLLNNYLICLRGVFKLAGREMDLSNPMDGIENSKHQAAPPDPLSRAEMDLVLNTMADMKMPVEAICYFEFAFMTGMRPEEIIALKWDDVDFASNTANVSRARTDGEYKPLKTYNARTVDLVKRAMEALSKMSTIGAASEFIFKNPVTMKPWHDDRIQRDHYWKPALVKAAIRYRRAYCTRHTYATNALAAGVNPTYISRQMGHANATMLFQVYAKWIDGADRGREKAKLEDALNQLNNEDQA